MESIRLFRSSRDTRDVPSTMTAPRGKTFQEGRIHTTIALHDIFSTNFAFSHVSFFTFPTLQSQTTMQVTGKFSNVVDKIKLAGPLTLYNGALAAASATFVGHYPWFFTYNLLSEKIPKQDTQLGELGRRAILGFSASAVSDTCSNSIRVVKVYKQSYPEQISYVQVISKVVQESGVSGLMFRGLETKILANGLQGILFSILWKHFEDVLFPKQK